MENEEKLMTQEVSQNHPFVFEVNKELVIPGYLDETYWWAYLHPKGVKFFDHSFIVDSILFGNYRKLRDTVVDNLGADTGNVLQMAAVYGNISVKIADKITDENQLDVVDVAPIQLQNLSRKVADRNNVRLIHQDSTALEFSDESYDSVLIFFLLHEVPDEEKYKILEQATRVVKPGGQIVIVDYHQPKKISPWRYLMIPVLKILEPFAISLWKREIISWLPDNFVAKKISKETYFMGLYQKVVIDI